MWELGIIVVCWEAVEVVNQVCGLGGVDFDCRAGGLPVCGKDDDGFWFHLLGDFATDLDELGIDWVSGIVDDVWLGMS